MTFPSKFGLLATMRCPNCKEEKPRTEFIPAFQQHQSFWTCLGEHAWCLECCFKARLTTPHVVPAYCQYKDALYQARKQNAAGKRVELG
jgi:hypothetical protein